MQQLVRDFDDPYYDQLLIYQFVWYQRALLAMVYAREKIDYEMATAILIPKQQRFIDVFVIIKNKYPQVSQLVGIYSLLFLHLHFTALLASEDFWMIKFEGTR